MIRSMTGFGAAHFEVASLRFSIEVRSVNHRHSDVRVRLPRRFSGLEPRMAARVQRAVSRGKLDVTVSAAEGVEAPQLLELNEPLAEQYHAVLERLRSKFGIREPLRLESFVALRDVVFWKEPDIETEAFWEAASGGLSRALDDLNGMREREGEALAVDLKDRLSRIEAELSGVRETLARAVEQIRAALREKVKALLQGAEPDPWRMEQEILFYAERMDTSEEQTRLASHLAQFRRVMEAEGPVGRKLDFLAQEMGRESNTLGAKVNNAEVSHRVVEIRAEMEKIREQVQNVE
jgi:uncharacterized protein (TIGR00255 family)